MQITLWTEVEIRFSCNVSIILSQVNCSTLRLSAAWHLLSQTLTGLPGCKVFFLRRWNTSLYVCICCWGLCSALIIKWQSLSHLYNYWPVLQSLHQHLSGLLLCVHLPNTLITVRVVATVATWQSHLFHHPKWARALFIKLMRYECEKLLIDGKRNNKLSWGKVVGDGFSLKLPFADLRLMKWLRSGPKWWLERKIFCSSAGNVRISLDACRFKGFFFFFPHLLTWNINTGFNLRFSVICCEACRLTLIPLWTMNRDYIEIICNPPKLSAGFGGGCNPASVCVCGG